MASFDKDKSQSGDLNYRLPSETTLKAVIGARGDSNEKILVKSEDEYTSTIVKFYKCADEFIVITENSIYIVANDIPTRRISS